MRHNAPLSDFAALLLDVRHDGGVHGVLGAVDRRYAEYGDVASSAASMPARLVQGRQDGQLGGVGEHDVLGPAACEAWLIDLRRRQLDD